MAQASLFSLIQSKENIMHNKFVSFSLPYKKKAACVYEKASSLQALLEESPWKFRGSLELRVGDAAFQAQRIIGFHYINHIRSKLASNGFVKFLWKSMSILKITSTYHGRRERRMDHESKLQLEDLQELIDQFDSILLELSTIKEEDIVDLQLKNTELEKAASIKITLAEFDEDLLQIKDQLRNYVPDGSFKKIATVKFDEDLLQIKDQLIRTGSSRLAVSNKVTMVDFHQDMLLQVKDQLTGSSYKRNVISIVGMGGIGKTTLAKNIYNDPLIEYHFHICAWITVSQEYTFQEMLTSLLGSLGRLSVELVQESIAKLEENLYQSLKGRRYLIVMDDVWDTKAWDDVKRLLPDDNNGSRIILTTRLSEVAFHADSLSPIQMRLLSLDEGWNLLLEKVFGENCCPPELEKSGKEILQNCKGLPLAIVVIGALLSKVDKTPALWKYVAEDTSSAITETGDKFTKILSLSYNHLPQHMKVCFLYMGVFPEDQEIQVSRLIKLWVAEGFLTPIGDKRMEDLAMENLKDLIDRSLILPRRLSYDGEIKTCGIHDLLRDLCIKIAEEEKFLAIIKNDTWLHPKGKECIQNQRRVSIQLLGREQGYPEVVTNSAVRSLLYFGKQFVLHGLFPFVMSFRFLRVLDALILTFHQFPSEIVELVNLKLLACTCNKSKFPPLISKLRNLQTLYVNGSRRLLAPLQIIYLPSEIFEMPELRHILFERCILLHPSGEQIGETTSFPLENLQTLSNVSNFEFTKKVFQLMPNLKKLVISYDFNWWSYDFDFSNFIHLHQLETLKCYIHQDTWLAWGKRFHLNFAFPDKLKKLTLSGCLLPWEKLTIVGSLPNIEVLKLKVDAFLGSVWEPNEGEFRSLKSLVICWNRSLVHWRANETHFPNLRHLSLNLCSELVEIPSEIGNISTLQLIELYQCNPSVVDSANQIKDEQQSLGNDDLRVRVLSYGDDHDYHEDYYKMEALKRRRLVSNFLIGSKYSP